ncbi:MULTISPECIES: sigma-54 interaction domain-containing protein [Desulfobacula]|uniref:PAS modulated sigma54 specific transcriptional regulator, Fis family n=2 Tax=Desulfobacula TaxID=28222 RepID=K0N7L5_DESTT|nr:MULTISPECIES: sigma 54-interacting transcriptional regulator [Desulfobacula]CCK79944.1 PAS modulated sigma54 specific transcriptional regulator, Fis family [Desulfobacula toluolica Tol2]SDU18644.1 PAS domain S-box-containing protein [Desulfobacula phenolica]
MDTFTRNTTETILESISDGVFTVDHEWKIMSFNHGAEKITGISRKEAIGKHCWNVFRSNMCQNECALKKTMQEGRSFFSSFTYIINCKKKRIPTTVFTSLLKDENGNIIGGVETFRDHSLVEELRKKLNGSFQMGDMISQAQSMRSIFKILPQISQSDSTVLIMGETGTGKELMAKAIHDLSPRKDAPFVAINCSALPDTLLESELFGYKAGAFTHATKDKPGQLSMANEGTVLLDEIGDTSPSFQVKLLRVLEEQAVLPLGAVKKEQINIRIIAATNKNLSQMVDANIFRQDLFYRINVVQLKLPLLKQRMEDIPLLVDHFIAALNKIQGKFVRGLSKTALEILMAHDYPGNIRELENIIEHAFVLCSKGEITPDHLPSSLTRQVMMEIEDSTSRFPLKAAEIKVIRAYLSKNNYDRNATARDLGIHKSTLFRKIDRLGIKLPKIDGRSKKK